MGEIDPNAPCSETGCDMNHVCDGVSCVPKPGPGEACESLDACAQPFICRDGTCQLINLSCEPAPAGEQCASLFVCDDAAYCDFFDGVTCKPRHALGEECSASRAFGDSRLEGLRCGNEGVCVTPVERGGSCESGELCELGVQCLDGLCGGPSGGGGRPCYQSEQCPESEFCHRDLERCVARLGEGADCFFDESACDDAHYCDSSTCAPRLVAGADCRDDEECAADLWCPSSSRTCETRVAMGAPCESHEDSCADGARCAYDSDASEYRCQRVSEGGEACDSDQDCRSGRCLRADDGEQFCTNSRACSLPE